jgi:PKD repeat protein
MSIILKKKVKKKREKLDLAISTSTVLLLLITVFSSIVLIATAQIGGAEEYTINTDYAPDAEFSANMTRGKAPLTVQFTDKSTGSPTEWKWSFGDGSGMIDGTTSAYQNPTHTYKEAGTYEVKETAINSAGKTTESKTGYITVTFSDTPGHQTSEYAPDADYSADIIRGDAPLTVQFTDKSTGSPTEWKWNFGDGSPIIDGTTSAYQNPAHTYKEAGTYDVKETAINSAGRNTEQKIVYITVKSPMPILEKPNAEFSTDITWGKAPLTIQFTDKSTGSPTEWEWNFGDGSKIIRIENPTHTYEEVGVYTVKETVTNEAGNDTETKKGYINVSLDPFTKNTTEPTPTESLTPTEPTPKEDPSFDYETVIPIVTAIIGVVGSITVAYIQRKNK